MNSIQHVAIIMDGNGRWGLKNKKSRNLGHKEGLKGEFKLLDIFKRLGVKYVSSDLRDVNNSLHPKLVTEDGKIRQPYRYENGMLICVTDVNTKVEIDMLVRSLSKIGDS